MFDKPVSECEITGSRSQRRQAVKIFIVSVLIMFLVPAILVYLLSPSSAKAFAFLAVWAIVGGSVIFAALLRSARRAVDKLTLFEDHFRAERPIGNLQLSYIEVDTLAFPAGILGWNEGWVTISTKSGARYTLFPKMGPDDVGGRTLISELQAWCRARGIEFVWREIRPRKTKELKLGKST